MRGLKDLHLAQNRDVHFLALKKLMKDEPLDDALFPEDVQDFAKRYFHKKRLTVPESKQHFVCQIHSAATRNARTTVHDRHAPTVPARNLIQSA